MLDEIHEYSKMSGSGGGGEKGGGQIGNTNPALTNRIAADYGVNPNDARRATDILDANSLMRAFLKTMSGDGLKVFKRFFRISTNSEFLAHQSNANSQ